MTVKEFGERLNMVGHFQDLEKIKKNHDEDPESQGQSFEECIKREHTAEDALLSAFVFLYSPEGDKYWIEIVDKLSAKNL